MNLFATIDATAKKAIVKIENYSQQQKQQPMSYWNSNFDLNERYRLFFPLFETYIVNFKSRVASYNQNSNVNVPSTNGSHWNSQTCNPTDWSWNTEPYNPNYYVTKVLGQSLQAKLVRLFKINVFSFDKELHNGALKLCNG